MLRGVSSPKPTVNLNRWRNVASQLQSYKVLYRESKIDYLTVVLAGLQSAGKTRFINVLAGKVVGGAMKDQTGTRCPVYYEFSTTDHEEQCKIGSDPMNLESIDPNHLWEKITDHMERIGDKFVKDILYVKISSPDSLTLSVFDLPGLKPDIEDKHFKDISEIYQSILDEFGSNVQLVLMTALPINLDVEFSSADMKKLRQAFGPHQTAFLNSYVIVSRLDSIRSSLGVDKLVELRNHLLDQKLITDPNKLIFLTLKPHLLDGSVDEDVDMKDKRNYNVAKQNEYYRNIRRIEKEKIDDFLDILRRKCSGQQIQEFNFGINEVLDRLDNLVIDSLKSNFRGIMLDLASRGEMLLRKHEELIGRRDLTKIQQLIRSYCRALSGILSCAAKTDTQSISMILNAERANFPDHVECLPTHGFRTIFNHLRHPFEREKTMYSYRCKDPKFKLLSQNVVEMIDSEHQLRKLCDDNLCGGSAVFRLLKVWMFVLVKEKMSKYSVDDIMTMCNMQDQNRVRAVSTNDVLRKIIEDIVCNYATQVDIVCDWAADLFVMQFEPLLEKIGPYLRQLDNFPKLKAYIDSRLQITHQRHFIKLADKAKQDIASSQLTRSSSLKLDTIYSLIRLLGCVRIPCALLQPDISRETYLEIIKKYVVPQSHHVLHQLETSKDNVPAVIKLLHSGHFTEEDFAMCDSMKTVQMAGRGDVEFWWPIINDTAQCLAKVNIGLNCMEAVDLIEKHITIGSHDLDKQLQKVMEDEIFKLFKDDNKLLKAKLHEENSERSKNISDLLTEMRQWQTTTQSLMDVGGNIAPEPILAHRKITKAIIKLEEELEESKLIDNTIAQEDIEEATEKTNQDDIISLPESNEDEGLSRRREEMLIDQIETLRGLLYAKSKPKNDDEFERLRDEIFNKDQRIRELEYQLEQRNRLIERERLRAEKTTDLPMSESDPNISDDTTSNRADEYAEDGTITNSVNKTRSYLSSFRRTT